MSDSKRRKTTHDAPRTKHEVDEAPPQVASGSEEVSEEESATLDVASVQEQPEVQKTFKDLVSIVAALGYLF